MAIRSKKNIIASIAVYMIAQLVFNFFVEPTITAALFYNAFFFLGITVFLVSEKRNLREFHLDKLSVLLVLFVPILWSFRVDLTREYFISIFIEIFIGILVFLNILDEYNKLPGFRWNRFTWASFASIAGLLLAVLIRIPSLVATFNSTQASSLNSIQFPEINWETVSFIFLYHLGQIAIIEETVFRGVIWGYLKRLYGSEKNVWLIQAGLFWILHIRQWVVLGDPYGFLIARSIFSLLAGWFVWRSRSLVSGIFFHAIYNVTILVINAIITDVSGGI